MIGYHAVSVIADAAAKGIGGFDREKAFAAMKHSADLKHFGLDAYTDMAYIGLEEERESVSKTLSMPTTIGALRRWRKMLGNTRRLRSLRCSGAVVQKRLRSRIRLHATTHQRQLASALRSARSHFQFYRSQFLAIHFLRPQDISGLIDLMGGQAKFAESWISCLPPTADHRARAGGHHGLIGQYAHGNEPSHHMAYLYNYAGNHGRPSFALRQIMDNFYKPEPDGLIGNEDCGQMSAWYVLSAAGFYPVTPGSTTYAIGSPLFPEVRFNLENGKTFVVRARPKCYRQLHPVGNIERQTLQQILFVTRRSDGRWCNRFPDGQAAEYEWGIGHGNEPVSRIRISRIVPVPVIKADGQTFRATLKLNCLRWEKKQQSSITQLTVERLTPPRKSL